MMKPRDRWLGALILIAAIVAALAIISRTALAAEQPVIEGTYPSGELLKLEVDGSNAYLIRPTKKTDPTKRWIWVAPFWLAVNDGQGRLQHRFYVDRFLEAGFHVAGVDVGTSCGSPRGAEVYQQTYQLLTSKYGLNARTRLLGQSNGGLITYAWAFRHPDSVDRIGGIYPAVDFRSWPGLANVVNFPDPKLGFGLSLDELTKRVAEFNPIDNLAPLAKSGVKIFHIHGDSDTTVPMDANSVPVMETFKKLGGDAELEVIKGLGHGGTPFYESVSLVRFLIE
jgi:pimeloyl-ACP methyl ester carboxylesterase